MKHKNCYLILHLSSSATEQDIKKSYRRLANIYHPDKPDGNAEQFRVIKEAYDTLLKAGISKERAADENYNTREMPEPLFRFVGITRIIEDEYILEIFVKNVIKIKTNGDNHWNIPHDIAYAKTLQPVRLKFDARDAVAARYKFQLEVTGTNGKIYDVEEEFDIPKPKPKSKFKKIIDTIW